MSFSVICQFFILTFVWQKALHSMYGNFVLDYINSPQAGMAEQL
jgi:hypothetical protein